MGGASGGARFAMEEREHLFGTSRWDDLSDSDEERELELERRIARRRAEQAKQNLDFDIGHALQSSTPKPKRLSSASVAPKQRSLVTVIPPPWAADHAAAAAAAASSQGGPAFVDGPYTGPQAPLAIRRDARPSQLFARAFGTYLLGVIWLIEALNYGVHVIFRPEPWNAVSVIIGYALWAVQLASLARCQLTDPGGVSSEWEAQAKAGTVPASACKRSGHLLPPRARYVRRAGRVIVGFDHWCHWLGTPIGFRNRKFFVLFVLYSAAFCAMGAVHSWTELLALAPPRLGHPPWGWAEWFEHEGLGARSRAALDWLHALVARADGAGCGLYARAVLATCAINPAGALLLGGMGFNQVLLVLLNRTTLDAELTRYDLGPRANWEQVFGQRPHLWPLPLYGAGPGGNGVSWPLNPRATAGLLTGTRAPPAPDAARAQWGRVLWVPLWAAQHGQGRRPNSGGAGHPQPAAPSCSRTAARWAPEQSCTAARECLQGAAQNVALTVSTHPGGSPVGALVLLRRLQRRRGAADAAPLPAGALQPWIPVHPT